MLLSLSLCLSISFHIIFLFFSLLLTCIFTAVSSFQKHTLGFFPPGEFCYISGCPISLSPSLSFALSLGHSTPLHLLLLQFSWKVHLNFPLERQPQHLHWPNKLFLFSLPIFRFFFVFSMVCSTRIYIFYIRICTMCFISAFSVALRNSIKSTEIGSQ